MEHFDTTVEYDTTVVHCNTTVKQLDTIVNTVTLEWRTGHHSVDL
jgi:hypothetical protein